MNAKVSHTFEARCYCILVSCNENCAPDIDECSTLNGLCENGRCINLDGGYRCECFPGYRTSDDGHHCFGQYHGVSFSRSTFTFSVMSLPVQITARDTASPAWPMEDASLSTIEPWRRPNLSVAVWEGLRGVPDVSVARGRAQVSDLWPFMLGKAPSSWFLFQMTSSTSVWRDLVMSPMEMVCPADCFHLSYELSLTYFLVPADIDECLMMPEACANGRCINTMGSYRCLCDNGYKVAPSGSECVDIDECTLANRCEFSCENTEGSFRCSCPKGYSLNADGKSCRDVDECKIGTHVCLHTCVNTEGSYHCGCQEGFTGQNGDCVGEQIQLSTDDISHKYTQQNKHTCTCLEQSSKVYARCREAWIALEITLTYPEIIFWLTIKISEIDANSPQESEQLLKFILFVYNQFCPTLLVMVCTHVNLSLQDAYNKQEVLS